MKWIAASLALVLSGCAVEESEDETSQALTSPNRVILEDTGRFIAAEGAECSGFYWRSSVIQRTGAWVPPTWVRDATIIYNGFSHRYLDTDRHVRTVQGEITGVTFGADGVLRWTFLGALHDKSIDDFQEVCHYYTVIGWDPANVAARSHVGFDGVDLDYEGIVSSAPIGSGAVQTTTIPDHCPFTANEPVAILPRGSRHMYADGLGGTNDHHVYQVGFAQTQDENPGNCVRYTTRMVLRDKNADDRIQATGRASFLGGTSVSVRSNAYTLPSRSPNYGAPLPTQLGGERVERMRVTGLTTAYALPMLTGWEVYYKSGASSTEVSGDQHVERIGVSIRNISYDRWKGILEYDLVSNLADQNDVPGHERSANVDILGLSPLVSPHMIMDPPLVVGP